MSRREETKAPAARPSEDWGQLPWRKLEHHVYRLQKRIYRAACRGNVEAVHRLEQLLMESRAARLLAVRRVTQDNQGKRTAGIDGIASVPPAERFPLVESVHPRNWHKPRPVRRVWIPKPGKAEKRPLGIPTMRDRASQALAKLALEPEWEAQFEPNSYGFRPGRSCHDAIAAIYGMTRTKAKWVLDADIQGCFDHIDHAALLQKLTTFPRLRRAIRAWLKAGVLEKGGVHPTAEGTPQGGVISPLLANVALHGMETALIEFFGWIKTKSNRPLLVRYADDFVVLMDTEQDVTQAQHELGAWLRGMGLTLHPDKTRIRHTLDPVEGQPAGFDFLGFTVRHFRVSDAHSPKNPHGKRMGAKCIIRPSKEAIRRHLRRTHEVVHRYGSAPQDQVIEKLNPIITGWARYYRTVVARRCFEGCDHVLFSQLRRWARRRHAHKGWKQIVRKYWGVEPGPWRFTSPNGSILQAHTTVKIRRHVKVRGDASPYDGNLLYWAKRLGDHPLVNNRLATVLRWQKGRCVYCGLAFKPDDLIELDHLLPRALGGRDVVTNLQALHRHCHDQKTAGDGSLATRRKGVDDNDYSTEEPDEGKRSCPVL